MPVLNIRIPRGFPTGGTLKFEVSKSDIGHNNVKSNVPTLNFCKSELNEKIN